MAFPLFVHSCVDDMTDITPNAFRVYMHLTRRADAGGMAWPSYQAIGDHCFASISDNAATRKSHARNAINELVEAGLVSKHSREREDGGQSSNGYVLSTVESLSPPVPIKHPPVRDVAPPMLNGHGPCLSGTKDTPYEDSPKEDPKPDGDSARARMGGVFEVWSRNIPGMMSEILGNKLADLVDECGEASVIYGIEASIEANARNFKYIAACARNHAAGKSPPVKTTARAPSGGDYRPSNATSNRQAVHSFFAKARAAQGVNGHG